MVFCVGHLPSLHHVHTHKFLALSEKCGTSDIVWKHEKCYNSHYQRRQALDEEEDAPRLDMAFDQEDSVTQGSSISVCERLCL